MDLPNNFNNSYITDVDIDTDNKFRKNTIISDSKFITYSSNKLVSIIIFPNNILIF